MSKSPFRIGLAGIGTVGGGVVALLEAQTARLAGLANRPLQITAASARHADKCPPGVRFVVDARALATAEDVDVVVEVIGGAEGPARELVEAALRAGKPVVTANKALLARHGLALALLAEENQAELRYEAAVAGGIPIISALCKGIAGSRVTRLSGIINGSTNYILSTMTQQGRAYADVATEAQQLGYLEADASLDVDGHDAAQKLALLSALAFAIPPDEAGVAKKGIRSVTLDHTQRAAAAGYVIKLIAEAYQTAEGVLQTVAPMLVPKNSSFAAIDGALNSLIVETVPGGTYSLTGPGAGAGPTASAIVSDLIAVARGGHLPVFGVAPSALKTPEKVAPLEKPVHSAELPYPVFAET